MPLKKQNSWQSAPFLRLLIPLIAGILIAFHLPVEYRHIRMAGCLSVLILFIFSWIPISEKFSWRFLSGSAIHMLMACMGAFCCLLHQIEKDPAWIGHHYQTGDTLLLHIEEPPVKKQKSWKTLAQLSAVKHHGQWIRTKGYAWLYMRDAAFAASVAYGDQLVIRSNMQRIGLGKAAEKFDMEGYRKYCALHQIYHQIFLKDTAIARFQDEKIFDWKSMLFQYRNNMLQTLKKFIPESREQAVAEALLIGYKEDLDRSLVQSYSNTGVVHIIAISGMHLAMIYGLLLMLFRPMGNSRWHQLIRAFVILSILWLFGFLTGGAAAILRSAVGFSFILLSKAIGYRNHPINALAASAFLLLVYDPFFLFDLGFILSYAAVTGIVLFNQPIRNWFHPDNKILQWIWELNAVTLAAQIFTLPVILYQFHRFPNLFLFTNLIIVPLSGLILYAEIAVLVCSPVKEIAGFFGWCCGWMIRQMNGLIERTDRIPFAVSEGIQLSLFQTILLFLVIFSILQWLMLQRKSGLIAALCLLLLIISIRSFSILL